ncbi:hypothetical protein KO488_04980 [Poseidonibacter lekithochrous]|uniref:hypothetical protein n=1 Tax=Poseidonibacter TaxID=2321187 RepID=UPI001C0904B4|nr:MULTISPECIES: hypothetical protein [Poseidonibacter]MBU3014101.1 hypothetical protein [Poseidonibacter lekithochrous]MDO6827399.1 hypothetical protein [Poseidonibacter sp. 1_MG-2023]
MKKIYISITLLVLTLTNLNAYSSQIKTAHAIGIFHQNGNGENIQHLRKTKDDYNGTCFSKIVVFGRLNNIMPDVKIGNSKGNFIKSIPIYNKQKIKIAQEMTFKHYKVTKGYMEVRVNNKLYDSKVFIK